MSLGSEFAEPSEARGGEGRVSQQQTGRVEWASDSHADESDGEKRR